MLLKWTDDGRKKKKTGKIFFVNENERVNLYPSQQLLVILLVQVGGNVGFIITTKRIIIKF